MILKNQKVDICRDCDFSYSNIANTDFTGVSAADCDLSEVTVSGCNMISTQFDNVMMSDTSVVLTLIHI